MRRNVKSFLTDITEDLKTMDLAEIAHKYDTSVRIIQSIKDGTYGQAHQKQKQRRKNKTALESFQDIEAARRLAAKAYLDEADAETQKLQNEISRHQSAIDELIEQIRQTKNTELYKAATIICRLEMNLPATPVLK